MLKVVKGVRKISPIIPLKQNACFKVFQVPMNRFLLYIGLSLLTFGCIEFEYSPLQAFDQNSPVSLNVKNLSRLAESPKDDTVRFIVSGDSQRSQDAVVGFVKKVNSMAGIDLVFLAGDISEFGTLAETEWVAREFQKLNVPFFGVIGNHDLIANGPAVFQRMFGELNYSLTYGGLKFICHDTNGREYKFNGRVPDINWLERETAPADGISAYVGISHVRPFSVDFDPALSASYSRILNSNPAFLASFHGHDHKFGEYYPDNSRVPFVITTSFNKRGFLLAEVVNDQIKYERVVY